MKGGLNLDYASTYGKELFSKIKVGFDVEGATGEFESEDLKEVSEAAGEDLSDKKVTKEVEKKNKRKAKLAKISENLGKFEKAIGRVQLIELQEKLVDYKKYLELLKAEANEDGNGEIIHPKTKQKVKDWDYYKDWKFIDFAEDKLFDPKGIKTNAEVLGFIIIK